MTQKKKFQSVSRRTFLQGAAASTLALTGCGMPGGFRSTHPKQNKKELVRMFTGVHNFMITPFNDDYSLNDDGLRRNILDHARHEHPDMTIVVSGGLGELHRMTTEEHRKVLRAAVAGANGVYPVIAGVGGAYPTAQRMARNAEYAGVDGIFLFAHPHPCSTETGAYEYLRGVADVVRVGVMIYICAERDFWPDVLKKLASDTPNIMGFKDGSGDVEVGKALDSLVGDEFIWIAESEGHTAKALPVGARAYTTAVGTFVPDGCHEFWRHGVAADVEKMNKALEERVKPVIQLRDVQPGYGISGIKVGLEALGRAGGPVRPPGTNVKVEDYAKIWEIAQKHSEPTAWRSDSLPKRPV